MAVLASSDLLAQLRWRYAVKRFDPTRTLTDDQWDCLSQCLVLSPSSYGIEPWKFFHIVNTDVRKRLQAAARGQAQVVEASHFLVLTIVKDLGQPTVESFIQRAAQARKVPVTALDGYKNAILGDLVTGPRHAIINEWSARQLYIALGIVLASAAVLGIDACPMEGFDIAQFDQILGLNAKGLTARVCCALGYRSADDTYASKPKMRLSRAEAIEVIA